VAAVPWGCIGTHADVLTPTSCRILTQLQDSTAPFWKKTKNKTTKKKPTQTTKAKTTGEPIHLILLTTCVHGFRNWKSPTFTTFHVITVSAMPDVATAPALLYLSQPRTAISVLIPVCGLMNSGRHNIVPFWRGLAPPA